MEKVLCSHKLNTGRFMCNGPSGRKISIEITRGRTVELKRALAELYPGTFKIISEEAPAPAAPVETKEEPLPVVEDAISVPTPADDSADAEVAEFDDNGIQYPGDLEDFINGFTRKKGLDEYGEELGFKLDRRESLSSMKTALIKMVGLSS